MARTVSFDVANDTCLFTPLQLQPTAAFRFGMATWASWLRAHVMSFPSLVRDHQLGAVVAGMHVTYTRPFGFFDSDGLRVEGSVKIVKRGALFHVPMRVFAVGGPSDGAQVIELLGTVRPVQISEASLSATPIPVPAALAARFGADEIDDAAPVARPVVDWLATIERRAPLAEARARVFCSRALCEIADQWSFVEVPGFGALGREQLVMEAGGREPRLRDGLRRPIRTIDVEYRAPAFAFDELEIHTRADPDGAGLVFTHRIAAATGAELRAAIVERF